jgi:hypothetical protein
MTDALRLLMLLLMHTQAAFRSLMSSPQWHTLGSNGIVLTVSLIVSVTECCLITFTGKRVPRRCLTNIFESDSG